MSSSRTSIERRRYGRALAHALALLGISPFVVAAQFAPPTGFPARCAPGQVEVMLLGTYHFAGSSSDGISAPADDILSPRRQQELDELVTRIARWTPQQIAVEWPYTFADSTDARYARWRSPAGYVSRNEVAQIGFRLGARLGHERIYPIDHQLRLGSDSASSLYERRPDLQALQDSVMTLLSAASAAEVARRPAQSLSEQLFELNSEARLHAGNSLGMFGALLPAGDGDNLAGPQILARWYERNIVMAHYLTRVLQSGTTRVLVIVGSGHVPPLRNILDESPAFCPVSPLSLLR